MSRIRGGRRGPQKKTSPTVKASAVMNTRNLRTRELRLSIYASVVLIGLVTGALAVSFYLGYYSGQTVGYEIARVTDVANVARIPIAAEDQDAKPTDNSVSEVYARLNEKDAAPRTAKLTDQGSKDQKAPDVAPILAADAAPLAKDPTVAALDASDVKHDDVGNDARAQMGKGLDTATVSEKKGAEAKKVAKEEEIGDETSAELSNDLQKNPAIKVLGGSEKADASDVDSGAAKTGKTQVAALTDNEKTSSKTKAADAKQEAAKEAHAKADAKKTTTAALNAPAPTTTLAKGWFAQVAAPRKQADADVLVKQLKASGFRTSIEHAQVRGEDYYRVLVGPEDNRTLAERLTSQLGREKYIKGEPFVRLVK